MEKKYVYSFNEGTKEMALLLGYKGANLAEMTRNGMPVPFGFTVTTEACNKYFAESEVLDQAVIEEIRLKLSDIENVMDKRFGDKDEPLILSVRAGAPVQMPGMLDSILNIGLNDETVVALAKMTGNHNFALDSYRRFIMMYGNTVLGIDKKKFSEILEKTKDNETPLDDSVALFKELVLEESGEEFPQDPFVQLVEAIKAVFRSWNRDRAILYRRLNDIENGLGTAVNVQAMVFGNKGDNSGSGIAFTRDPITGDKGICGGFLANSQGEAVLDGESTAVTLETMGKDFPNAYKSLVQICEILEEYFLDAQEIEFTIEDSVLYLLSTKEEMRNAQAAVKMAVDMVNEGLINRKTAVLRVSPEYIEYLMRPRFDSYAKSKATKIAQGTVVSAGTVSGELCFSVENALQKKIDGKRPILACEEISAEELATVVGIEGLLLVHGSEASHAAVVAKQLKICCVAGFQSAELDLKEQKLSIDGKDYFDGDFVSINGADGSVYEGEILMLPPDVSGDFERIMEWADEFRTMKVRTNADTPQDAAKARRFGAEGIGLCRTEYMFFADKRINAIREMIFASNEEERRVALAKILPLQKSDFKKIYRALGNLPVNIRLLDPPLHEFLPKTKEEILALSQNSGISASELRRREDMLRESNPMLGHRGLRLAITHPEIAEMQTEAIISAAIEVSEEENIEVIPEITIPLAQSSAEFSYVKAIVTKTAERIMKERNKKIEYNVGTMIEVPRACLVANEIAKEAEFFSFGTNDLTQMTFAFSRNDTAELIEFYQEKGILEANPFKTIDQNGVGKLMKMATDLGKKTRPDIKLGICGNHGSDPKSIEFCQKIGLNYVSCAPYKVPVARMAAAHAAIKEQESE